MSIAGTSRGGAIHWNGGNGLGLTSCDGSRCAQVVANIRHWQVNVRQPPFRDIAYNHLVCPGCGTIHVGRGWGVRSAANGTNAGNTQWHAWMVLFGGDEPFTDRAKQGLLTLHAEHRRRYGRSRLTTHRAVRGGTTACPGPDIIRWVADGAPAPTAGDNMAVPNWAREAWGKARRVGMFTDHTRPDTPVTSAELAVYLERLGLLEEGQAVPSWAADAVKKAVADGTILPGTAGRPMRRYDWLVMRGR